MTFEEWMKYNNYSLKGMMSMKLSFYDAGSMSNIARCQSKRINLLEQRIIELQGHDDLSYIDKKLSKQEGE
jgi:hypothetical protein